MARNGSHSVFGPPQVAVTSWPCSTSSGLATILTSADSYHWVATLNTQTTPITSTTSMTKSRSPMRIHLEAKFGRWYQWMERCGCQILRNLLRKLLDKVLSTLAGMWLTSRCSLLTVFKVLSLVSCGTSPEHTARHSSTAPTLKPPNAGYSRTRTRWKTGLLLIQSSHLQHEQFYFSQFSP